MLAAMHVRFEIREHASEGSMELGDTAPIFMGHSSFAGPDNKDGAKGKSLKRVRN